MSASASAGVAGVARAGVGVAGGGGRPVGRVACVAVINHNNAPLFLKVFKDAAGSLPRQTDDVVRMQMHEVVYNSLDVVEERLVALRAQSARDNDGFLGCLAVVGPMSLYGFVTNTHLKFIIALRSSGPHDYKDSTVKALFRKLHAAVIGAFLNPFTLPDAPIVSAGFEARVDEIARRFG
ncbi:hypothetical protein I4F81_009637 [Pyropia yezoensis]|uniref:Uncharacterized protein n=1 Tax=Pyropia yezoensis TaxID=2788 RepID=A0ACC3CAM6_PYRYE|nr:hypothetical protein I4F81_009637 [Neopyropia yezoensis]